MPGNPVIMTDRASRSQKRRLPRADRKLPYRLPRHLDWDQVQGITRRTERHAGEGSTGTKSKGSPGDTDGSTRTKANGSRGAEKAAGLNADQIQWITQSDTAGSVTGA